MKRAAVALLLVGVAACAAESPTVTPIDNAPARDGDIAIREELDAARKAGTKAAYDLFIARHPGHPLAAAARAERAKLQR